MMHKFVSENWEKCEQLVQDLNGSNVDIFGLIEHEYQLYLRQHEEKKEGDDEFMRMSAYFCTCLITSLCLFCHIVQMMLSVSNWDTRSVLRFGEL